MATLYLMKTTLDMVNLARYAGEQRHSDPDRTAHCLRTCLRSLKWVKLRLLSGEG